MDGVIRSLHECLVVRMHLSGPSVDMMLSGPCLRAWSKGRIYPSDEMVEWTVLSGPYLEVWSNGCICPVHLR